MSITKKSMAKIYDAASDRLSGILRRNSCFGIFVCRYGCWTKNDRNVISDSSLFRLLSGMIGEERLD